MANKFCDKANVATIQDRVIQLLAKGFNDLGFVAREPFVFTKPLSDEAHAWVGVQCNFYNDCLSLRSNIGLLFPELKKRIDVAAGYPLQQWWATPLLTTSIYMALPGRQVVHWSCSSEETTLTATRDLVVKVQDYGVPAMSALSSLSAVQVFLTANPKERAIPWATTNLGFLVVATLHMIRKGSEAGLFAQRESKRLRDKGHTEDAIALEEFESAFRAIG